MEGRDDEVSLCNILSYREKLREGKSGKLTGVSKVYKMIDSVFYSVWFDR